MTNWEHAFQLNFNSNKRVIFLYPTTSYATKGTSLLVLLQTNIKVKKQTISMLKLY